MKKRSAILWLAALIAIPAQAQQTAPPAKTEFQVKVTGQWEYLVVSFGKTYFSSALDGTSKVTGDSKLLMYGPLGAVVAQEAQTTQSQVDTLGRYGWEMVSVLGAIGGDQQWVFKRPYEPARSAKEIAAIKAEGQQLLAAREKAAKQAALQPSTPASTPQVLINLDTREAEEKQNQANLALRNRYQNALKIPGWNLTKIDLTGVEDNKYANNRITIGIDLTSKVLKGNTYRSSEVAAVLSEYLSSLEKSGKFSAFDSKKYSCSFYDGEVSIVICI